MEKSSNLLFRMTTKLTNLFNGLKSNCEFDINNIPVIINNFNRLNYLKRLVNWLESAGFKNIYIIDNNSDYQPLLDYYNITPHIVYRLDRNKGHFALWETVIFSRFSNHYYIYTDPDLLPVEECPLDVVKHFCDLLQKYSDYSKVGFGLKIDDLPDDYPLKDKVLKWESMFWKREVEKDVYDAHIDTTFALYRPGARGGADIPALRTGGKYMMRHLPWYEIPNSFDNETSHYYSSAGDSSSWYSVLKGKQTDY